MHEVLFSTVGKIAVPLHQRVLWPCNVNLVFEDLAGMGHPLAAHHELIGRSIAEGIAH